MVVSLPKMAMVPDCDGGGIAAVCVERKRRFRHVRLHYIQCFQVININYSSAANSNSYFLFFVEPASTPASGAHRAMAIVCPPASLPHCGAQRRRVQKGRCIIWSIRGRRICIPKACRKGGAIAAVGGGHQICGRGHGDVAKSSLAAL